MLLKCKKCGTQIEVPDGTSYIECKKCGEPQNIPTSFGTSDNARIEVLYQKALAALNSARTENDYITAKAHFEIIMTYKDSQQKVKECEKKLTECTYNTAVSMLSSATAPIQFAEAKAKFESLGNYKDSLQLIKECDRKYEISRKDDLYDAAIALLNNSTDTGELELAIMQLDSIIGHRDAREQINKCRAKIEQLKNGVTNESPASADETQENDSKSKLIIIAAASAVVVGGVITALCLLL